MNLNCNHNICKELGSLTASITYTLNCNHNIYTESGSLTATQKSVKQIRKLNCIIRSLTAIITSVKD